MALESFPDVNIVINPQFLRRYPQLGEEEFVLSILSHPWNLPTLESNVYLPGMGSTGHGASPTSFLLPRTDKYIEIFAKPSVKEMAKQEFGNALISRKRGVNTPLVLALVEFKDEFSSAWVLSKLLHNVQPLSARNLDFSLTDPRAYSPKDLVADFVGFIARDVHGKGVAHGDLHLGNLGFLFSDRRPPSKIIFDLESSLVLNDHELSLKKKGYPILDHIQERIDVFESMATQDLATFLAYLSDRNFPLSPDELLAYAADVYQKRRPYSYGMVLGKEYDCWLGDEYEKKLNQLKRIDELD